MRLVPETVEGKINFYRSHMDAWLQHAEAIGLSGEFIASLQADLDAAEEALATQRAAQQAAQAATGAAAHALERLCRRGAGALTNIRAKAVQSGGDVFTLAMIPAPSRRKTAVGPPSQPSDFQTRLLTSGWLEITWKCTTPRSAGGTFYHVSRQLDGTGAFEDLAIVGSKKYIDRTVPPGMKRVTYKVLPRRSTCAGDSALHVVNLAGSSDPPEIQTGPPEAERAWRISNCNQRDVDENRRYDHLREDHRAPDPRQDRVRG
jgi:hypothetical protein